MELTEDSFRALARSSPWRWRTLHFTRRNSEGAVAAWVRRPGRLLVREPGQPDVYESGVPYGRSWVSTDPDVTEPVPRFPHEVDPELRLDGLVAERPPDRDVDYDDPMYGNFTWVAMLDPVELSHHTLVDGLRAEARGGRETWRARLRAAEGYEPRCGCCALLWSEISDREEYDESGPPAGTVYPDAYDVALDVQTGVVVELRPVGADPTDLWLEVDIHRVDADVDELFADPG